ncbi:MAG TPA: hypothetical protein DCY07_04755 [Rhodospirillaceae bacterium]|nr:hypothetical protein [Rhodospirillaceae bacterium]
MPTPRILLWAAILVAGVLSLPLSVAAVPQGATDQDPNTGYIQFKFDNTPSLRMAQAASVATGQPCLNTTAPAGDKTGALRYNSAINNVEYCDGTTWNILGAVKNTSCAAATKGALRYNSSMKMMEYCDGAAWRLVGVPVPTAGCTAAAAGTVRYNSVDKKMEYCDGSNWARFGSTLPLGINYAGCNTGWGTDTGDANNWHHLHYTSAANRAPANDENTNIICKDKEDVVVSMENGHLDTVLCCTVKFK